MSEILLKVLLAQYYHRHLSLNFFLFVSYVCLWRTQHSLTFPRSVFLPGRHQGHSQSRRSSNLLKRKTCPRRDKRQVIAPGRRPPDWTITTPPAAPVRSATATILNSGEKPLPAWPEAWRGPFTVRTVRWTVLLGPEGDLRLGSESWCSEPLVGVEWVGFLSQGLPGGVCYLA